MLHQASDIGGGSQTVGHAFQYPCKRQNEHGRHHLLKTIRQTIHTFAKRQRLARQIIGYGYDKCYRRAQHQPHRGIAGCKGVYETLALEESACIYHADNTSDNEKYDWDNQV